MKKIFIVTALASIIVCVAAGLSYYTVNFPMRATVSEEPGTWEYERLPLNFWSSDVMPDGTTIIATVRGTAKVYKSLNEGVSWTEIFQIPTGLPDSASLTFCDSHGNIYVSITNNPGEVAGLWRSYDGGETWARVWQEQTNKPHTNVRFRGMSEVDGTLYFGTSCGPGGPCDIYRSTNRGVTWQHISSIPGGKHIHSLQHNPYNGWFYAVVGDPGYPANGLWRSKDNCLTWKKFTNLGDVDIMSIGFYQDYVYAAIHWESGQVKRLRDNDKIGASFEEVFRSGLRLQNWVQLYKGIMLTGGEDSTSSSYPVGIWASDVGPFNAGTWYKVYEDGVNTGYKGTACASHKISKNGWLFVANSFEGQGLRIRSGSS